MVLESQGNPIQVEIVILNYNGRELLPQCLPSIVKAAEIAARQHGISTQVTLLDNLSKDDGLEWARDHFPDVKIVLSPENKILCSYNDYLAASPVPVSVLLNNDIRVDAEFLEPLVRPFFSDDSLFLVAPKVMSFDGKRLEAGPSRARMHFGLFKCTAQWKGFELDTVQPGDTASSGFGAVSTRYFNRLKGYDPLFLPGIFEDVDLCFRAKRAGLRLRYEPRSVVYHMGQASFKKTFGGYGIQCLAARNNFLFMWKNFKGIRFWCSHLVCLPFRFLLACLRGQFWVLEGWSSALKKQWMRP